MRALVRTVTLAGLGALAFGGSVYWLARDGQARAVERLVGSYSTGSDGGGGWWQLELQHDGTFLHARGETLGERAVYSDELGGVWRRDAGQLELTWSDGRVESATVTTVGVKGQLELELRGSLYRELVPLCCY